MTDRQLEDQADTPPQPVDEPDEPVSWGPTFGPETEADATRRKRHDELPWHPPGGPW